MPAWYDPWSSPSSRPREPDPALPVVPGTGAPSPRPHCSPPLAALHLHLLIPSMPSPRSPPSRTARYPTATHHPSKSGSICVSQVAQCDVMPSSFPHVTPSLSPTPARWDRCMWILLLFVTCPLSNPVVLFRLNTPCCFWQCSDFSVFSSLYIRYFTILILFTGTEHLFSV